MLSRSFCFVSLFLIGLASDEVAAKEYAAATMVGKPDVSSLVCRKGEFWDPRNGGECWSCNGKKRTIFAVDSNKACETPGGLVTSKATRHF